MAKSLTPTLHGLLTLQAIVVGTIKYSHQIAVKYKHPRLQLSLLDFKLRQTTNNLLSLSLQSRQQLRTCWNILDQPNTLASTPDTIVRVASFIHLLSSRTRDQVTNVFELGSTWSLFDRNDFDGDLVLENSSGVVQCSEDMDGILFI